jgi:hypothetical protein
MPIRGYLPLVLLCLLPAACTRYSAPRLEVVGVQLVEETATGMVLRCEVDATNRNNVELPLREVRYTLKLEGQPAATGLRSPEASLPRFGTQRITFPAVLALGPDRPRPSGTLRFELDGQIMYITPGQFAQVLFDINVRRPKVSFDGDGVVELGSAPAPAPSAPPE